MNAASQLIGTKTLAEAHAPQVALPLHITGGPLIVISMLAMSCKALIMTVQPHSNFTKALLPLGHKAPAKAINTRKHKKQLLNIRKTAEPSTGIPDDLVAAIFHDEKISNNKLHRNIEMRKTVRMVRKAFCMVTDREERVMFIQTGND